MKESDGIAEIAREYDASVPFMRPPELSQSDVLLPPVVEHAVESIDDSVRPVDDDTPVVVLQPNIPFRRPDDIERALDQYDRVSNDTLVSVVQENQFFWRRDAESLSPLFSERQRLHDEIDPLFRETGSITVTSPATLSDGTWTGKNPAYIVTDKLSSFEVTSVVDFWLAERIAKGPTIVFRVDGGDEIGLGKIYRALTLATELHDILNCNIKFVSDSTYPGGIELVAKAGFDVVEIADEHGRPKAVQNLDPDLVFIDIERPSEQYLEHLHQHAKAVVNLEGFSEESLYADYVINPQRESEMQTPSNQLSGTDYLVMRDEFKHQSPDISPRAEKVLITSGGSDPLDLTLRIVGALGPRKLPFSYKLVIGPDFGSRDELERLPDEWMSKFEVLSDVSNMGRLMAWADVAISSGGRTVYELAATGTPSIVIAQNNGEVERMGLLREQEAIEFLGYGRDVSLDTVPDRLTELANDRQRRSLMSERAQELVDGRGVQRIIDLVHKILIG